MKHDLVLLERLEDGVGACHVVVDVEASAVALVAFEQGLFLGTFLVVLWQFLHTSTMSQTITDIHGSSQIFQVEKRWYHFNYSFSRKKDLLTFLEGFLSWAEGALSKSQKALFPQKNGL